MSDRDEGAPAIRIAVSPEPTDEEAAAIAAVVTALAASVGEAPAAKVAPEGDRWADAGRHEALRRPLWPVGWDDGQ